MEYLQSTLSLILSGLRRPATMFAAGAPAWRAVFFAFIAMSVVLGLLLYLSGLIMDHTLLLKSDMLDAYVPVREGALSVFQIPTPAQRLLFPLYWTIFCLFAAGVRFLTISVFGEKNRAFTDVLTITIFGLTPVVLISGLQGIVNNFFPLSLSLSGAVLWIKVILTIVVFFAAIIWEAKIFISAARVRFEQNIGRAVLTWLAPYASIVGIVLVGVQFLGLS